MYVCAWMTKLWVSNTVSANSKFKLNISMASLWSVVTACDWFIIWLYSVANATWPCFGQSAEQLVVGHITTSYCSCSMMCMRNTSNADVTVEWYTLSWQDKCLDGNRVNTNISFTFGQLCQQKQNVTKKQLHHWWYEIILTFAASWWCNSPRFCSNVVNNWPLKPWNSVKINIHRRNQQSSHSGYVIHCQRYCNATEIQQLYSELSSNGIKWTFNANT